MLDKKHATRTCTTQQRDSLGIRTGIQTEQPHRRERPGCEAGRVGRCGASAAPSRPVRGAERVAERDRDSSYLPVVARGRPRPSRSACANARPGGWGSKHQAALDNREQSVSTYRLLHVGSGRHACLASSLDRVQEDVPAGKPHVTPARHRDPQLAKLPLVVRREV